MTVAGYVREWPDIARARWLEHVEDCKICQDWFMEHCDEGTPLLQTARRLDRDTNE
jgi:hypothetical protein